MKLEDQLASFEQAKRLVELKVNLNTLFYFCLYRTTGWINIFAKRELPRRSKHVELYPAPTCAELGKMLPKIITCNGIEYYHHGSRLNHGGFFSLAYETADNYLGSWMESTEAQARAEALIWLLEQKLITAEEMNRRVA